MSGIIESLGSARERGASGRELLEGQSPYLAWGRRVVLDELPRDARVDFGASGLHLTDRLLSPLRSFPVGPLRAGLRHLTADGGAYPP